MEIKKVGVLGCGLMGSGIAQTAAMTGFQTIVREVSDDLIQKGFAAIEKSLAKFAEKGTITAEQQKKSRDRLQDRKSTRLNSSHSQISYAVFCLKKKKSKSHHCVTFL